MNKEQQRPWLFKAIKYLVRLFYPKIEIVGMENLPDKPVVIVGNHTQLHGPIACELYFPDNYYTWCAGQMMKLKEVPGYAYTDFWSQKPKIIRPLFKLVSYIIAPLSVLIFKNARTIAVYKDKRILSTIRETISKLQDGNSVVIFPEHDKKYNNIIYDFQEGFVDVARLYYKRTGKELSFVPLYIAPKLKKMYLGKPIIFSADAPIAKERRRICDYLMQEITDIARSLPEHTVVPYRNIPKKYYPTNIQKEAEYEKTRC
ncbi:MAG: 1-acyl-sn-glycerol-3-phosphate acyltransferase [Clostridia bacterium]|nr:1-acyl-sn-glycerol-3-phosphate acyltransferase [Clostridia bacterium]